MVVSNVLGTYIDVTHSSLHPAFTHSELYQVPVSSTVMLIHYDLMSWLSTCAHPVRHLHVLPADYTEDYFTACATPSLD